MILELFFSLYFCHEFKDMELIEINSMHDNKIISLLSDIIFLLNVFNSFILLNFLVH